MDAKLIYRTVVLRYGEVKIVVVVKTFQLLVVSLLSTDDIC